MTLHIDLADREGALERLLGTCRRRGFLLRDLQARPDGQGLLRLQLTLDPGRASTDRLLATLYRIHDIHHIHRAEAAAQAA